MPVACKRNPWRESERGVTRQFRGLGSYLWTLIDLRAVLLGLALLHLIVTQVWINRWYQAFGESPGNSRPDSFADVPLVLVLACALLVIGKLWSYLAAVIGSAWVLYEVGYLIWSGTAAAHNLSFFSFSLLQLLTSFYLRHPHLLFQLALAIVIAGYILVVTISQRWAGRTPLIKTIDA